MKRRLAVFAAVVFAVFVSISANAYQLYFGDLHSHTSFSDGTGLPADAFDTARFQAHLDFWTVSDHVEQLGYRTDLIVGAPKEIEWDIIKKTALEKTEDGKFVALAGFEWATDPTQGHVNIFNTGEHTDFANGYPLKRMYVWLSKHPSALMGFNHPNEGSDEKLVFNHFAYVPQIASQTIYVATNLALDFPFYYMALDNGWWVAPAAQQDNHSPDWGMHPSGNLTGVYADKLTYASLIDAFRNRRFYATNDRKIKLMLEGNGLPMGSRISADSANLEISVDYEGGTAISSVKLVSNSGNIVKQWNPGGSKFKESVSMPADTEETHWFVVLVEAPNNRFAMSAPIILKKTSQ
jgi:hypothetical protein